MTHIDLEAVKPKSVDVVTDPGTEIDDALNMLDDAEYDNHIYDSLSNTELGRVEDAFFQTNLMDLSDELYDALQGRRYEE
jgi:hypothetical protein